MGSKLPLGDSISGISGVTSVFDPPFVDVSDLSSVVRILGVDSTLSTEVFSSVGSFELLEDVTIVDLGHVVGTRCKYLNNEFLIRTIQGM